MQTVLKTVNSKDDLDYDEPFNSEKNAALRRSLIPELRKSLASNFRPSVDQITNWLKSLHKSRRSARKIKKSGKGLLELRRIHNNNRVHEISK
jgi:hypothetical protein